MNSIGRRQRARIPHLALACVAAWLLSACGSDEPADTATPKPGKPAAARRAPPVLDETGLEAALEGDISIPTGFPKDVPMYPGAVPTATMSSEGQGTLVTFDSNDEPQRVFDFYEEQLIDNGWSIESSATMGSQWMLSAVKDDRKAHISIAGAKAGSQIGVAIAKAQ